MERLHGVAQTLVVEESLDVTDSADGKVLVPQVAVGKVHDVLLGDGIDLALNLAGHHATAGGDDLATNVLGNGGGAVKREQDRSLELGLGALNLGTANVGAETHPLLDGEVDEVIDTGDVVADEVNAPETSIAVAGGEGHEAVGKLVLVDEAAELAALMRGVAEGLVVVANDGLGDEGSEVVRRRPADTLNSKGNVGSAEGIVTDADVGADEVSLLLGQGGGTSSLGKTREVLLGELDELLVGDTTRANKDHAVSSVVLLDVVGQLGAGDVADVLAGAENGAAESLALEGSGVEVIEDDLLNLLLNLLGLAEDHVALALDGRLLELGVLENVGKDVDALGHIRVEGLGEVNGVLALLAVRVERRLFG